MLLCFWTAKHFFRSLAPEGDRDSHVGEVNQGKPRVVVLRLDAAQLPPTLRTKEALHWEGNPDFIATRIVGGTLTTASMPDHLALYAHLPRPFPELASVFITYPVQVEIWCIDFWLLRTPSMTAKQWCLFQRQRRFFAMTRRRRLGGR
jgi:hypothetical protein